MSGEIPPDVVMGLEDVKAQTTFPQATESVNDTPLFSTEEPFDAKFVHKELLARRDARRMRRKLSLDDIMKLESESKDLYDGALPDVNEHMRLSALRKMNILDTPMDENFDRITRLASNLFGTKVALISLVDRYRQWFKSAIGLDIRFTCRNVAFCSFAIKSNEVLVVLDATEDPRFSKNPLVTGSPHVRFYAGAPLRSSDGFNLGTFCLIDFVPRDSFDQKQQDMLKDIASVVVREMELNRQNQATAKMNARQNIVSSMYNQTLKLNTIDELYEMNTLRIAEVLDADYVQILEFSEDKQHFIMRAGFGWNSKSLRNGERDFKNLVNNIFPHLATPQWSHRDLVGTYVIDDMSEVFSEMSPPSSPGLLQLHSISSGMCSILYHKEKPFGMIGVFDEYPHAWLEEDVMFLTNCGRSLSVLIERTQHALELAHERQRADELLYTILPLPISQRLKTSEDAIADAHAAVTIMFADIVNFTQVSMQVTPKELVSFLNKVFSCFDIETLTRGLEKIKIIGDCYMVAGGLFSHEADHAEAVVELACDILVELDKLLKEEYASHPFFANVSVRIGINTGPVVAGVIGLDRFLYDVWGDAVNTASRLESTGLPGHIHISESTMAAITNKQKFEFEERGFIHLKGKGEMQTLFVRKNPEYEAR